MGIGTAVILGSGTSNGVPMLGHVYPPGYLDNPKNHRRRASILLQGPTGNLLIDCPPELRLQLTDAGIYDIEPVLISHTHADHVMGMDDLRSICMVTGKPITVYARSDHQVDIKRIFEYAFREFPPGVVVPRFDLIEVPELLNVGGMEIRTFVVDHGKMKVVGVRVNDFAYITDVSYIPPEAEELLYGLDAFVVDGVRYKPHPNHFNFDQALECIAKLKPKRAYLTHLSHDYDHDVTRRNLPDGVDLAYDGLEIAF